MPSPFIQLLGDENRGQTGSFHFSVWKNGNNRSGPDFQVPLHADVDLATMAQAPQTPDIQAQRTAMKKLGFLVGEWAGQATVARGPGILVELSQTEVAQFKLGGLVLMIEGIGRAKADGNLALQALGLISFDDASGSYRMRAYNDGRWLETEVKLLEEGTGMTWGFSLGEISTKSVLRINDKGEWTEIAEITFGARPPQKLIELVVRREKA
jgi:hypothetical protein